MTPRHRLEALLDLSRRLSSSLDLDRVVADFARSAAELLDATSCAISVLDADGATLTTLWDHEQRPDRAASRPGAIFADLAAFPATRRVLDEQRALVISADRAEDDDAERRDMAALHLRTRLMVPLVARGESVGLLELGHADRDGFAPDDIEFCQALADLFAPALHNATLHRRLVDAQAPQRSHLDHIPALYKLVLSLIKK
jgi:GAF domain-containing protein